LKVEIRSLMGIKRAGEKCDDSQSVLGSLLLLPLPPPPPPPPSSEWEAGSQGAGAALSVNGLKATSFDARAVTDQQHSVARKMVAGFG